MCLLTVLVQKQQIVETLSLNLFLPCIVNMKKTLKIRIIENNFIIALANQMALTVKLIFSIVAEVLV